MQFSLKKVTSLFLILFCASAYADVNPNGPISVNIDAISGLIPTPGSSLPVILSNGSVFYDARQIRDLNSSTDSVTSFQGGSWNVGVLSLPSIPAGSNNIGIVGVTGPITVVQPTGSSLHVSVDSVPTTTVTGTVAATQSGAWTTGRTWALTSADIVTALQGTSPWIVSGTVGINNFPATQPVSGTVTVNQGTSPWVVSGTVTANIGTTNGLALDTSVNSLLKPASTLAAVTSVGSITNTVTVGQATGTNLHVVVDSAPSTPITGTVTANQGTSPWVTSATQSGTWTVQQGTPPWSVSQSGTWTTGRTWSLLNTIDSVNIGNFPATQPISAASLPLPTGASTSALQTTGNAILSTISGQLPTSLGAKTTANSIAVTIASDQSIGTPTETSVSCATSTTTLLAASAATKFIAIRNPTIATATVWVNIAGASAVVSAPSIDLPPGAELSFTASENSFLPTSQINCISGGASASTLTLYYK